MATPQITQKIKHLCFFPFLRFSMRLFHLLQLLISDGLRLSQLHAPISDEAFHVNLERI